MKFHSSSDILSAGFNLMDERSMRWLCVVCIVLDAMQEWTTDHDHTTIDSNHILFTQINIAFHPWICAQSDSRKHSTPEPGNEHVDAVLWIRMTYDLTTFTTTRSPCFSHQYNPGHNSPNQTITSDINPKQMHFLWSNVMQIQICYADAGKSVEVEDYIGLGLLQIFVLEKWNIVHAIIIVLPACQAKPKNPVTSWSGSCSWSRPSAFPFKCK